MRILLSVFVVLLASCDLVDSSLAEIPDKELRERNYRCQMASSLSAAEIQVCRNIRRECDARAEKGRYVC